jgi:hypothetical protein
LPFLPPIKKHKKSRNGCQGSSNPNPFTADLMLYG